MIYSIAGLLDVLIGPKDGRTRPTVAGIRNNTAIPFVNAAGTANVDGIKLNASDIVEIPAANGLLVDGQFTATGATTLSGAVTQKPNFVSGSGATVTLTAAQSGSVILFDRAAGIVFTLPAPSVGLYYDFLVKTSVTSNAYKVITDAGTTLLVGSLINIDTDSSNAVAAWTGNGSTHISVSMNGTTTGGLVGTWMRFTCISATQWMVTGIDQGSGVVATPFATS